MKITINQLFLVIALILATIWIFGDHSLNLNISEHNTNTISVGGKAEKYVAPDTAKVSFAINEYNKSQKIAADKVNKKTKVITNALLNMDINKEDIKTKSYSVYPQYNWSNEKRKFENYRVSQSVEVKIRDLEKVSKVLAKIVELKVDNLNGPNMFIDNLDQIKKDLRKEAIANAKNEAEKLASELSISLDKIVSFSESGGRNYYSQPLYAKSYDTLTEAASVVSEPEIFAGEDKIVKEVTITFQIKN